MTLNYEAGNVFAKFTSYTNNVDDYIYLMDETEEEHEELRRA